jgi:hypothetical protein
MSHNPLESRIGKGIAPRTGALAALRNKATLALSTSVGDPKPALRPVSIMSKTKAILTNPNSLMNRSQSLSTKAKDLGLTNSTKTAVNITKVNDPQNMKKKKMSLGIDSFDMFEPTNTLD